MRLEELPLLGCQHKHEARHATTQDPDGVWQGGVVKRLADRGADNGGAGGRHKPLQRGSSAGHGTDRLHGHSSEIGRHESEAAHGESLEQYKRPQALIAFEHHQEMQQ